MQQMQRSLANLAQARRISVSNRFINQHICRALPHHMATMFGHLDKQRNGSLYWHPPAHGIHYRRNCHNYYRMAQLALEVGKLLEVARHNLHTCSTNSPNHRAYPIGCMEKQTPAIRSRLLNVGPSTCFAKLSQHCQKEALMHNLDGHRHPDRNGHRNS